MKTKGEPKAGAGLLTNYQPESGANHICYKNATQSRGNLVSVQIDILFGDKPAEKMDRGQHMSQRRGDYFILNENPTQCRGLADFVNPLPGWGGGGGGGIPIHSLTRVIPPPSIFHGQIFHGHFCTWPFWYMTINSMPAFTLPIFLAQYYRGHSYLHSR